MKTIFNILICLQLSICFSSAQSPEFYNIPTYKLDLLKLYPSQNHTLKYWNLDSVFIWENPPIQISRQVSLKEYKVYLEAIKKDSSESFYLSQLPDSSICSPKSYGEYLSNPKYDDFPVVGVSWQNAFNYARWLTLKENQDDFPTHIYRLPQGSEWLVAKYHLDSIKKKHDFDKTLADWTIEAYSENMPYGFSCCENSDNMLDCLTFFAKDNDSQNWKRKLIIGKSYWLQEKRNRNLAKGDWQFQFNGTAHVGFRLVKENTRDSSILSKKILEFWEEHPTFYKKRNHDYINNSNPNELFIQVEKQHKKKKEKITLIEKKVNVVCECSEERFNGLYESYYLNGTPRAKGYFNNNQRIGVWSLWDSLGNLVLTRDYQNGVSYKQTFPKANNALEELLLNEPKVTQYRNKEGIYDWYLVHEKDVYWENLVNRILPKNENPLLFDKNNMLLDKLLEALSAKKITAYKDYSMSTILDSDNIPGNFKKSKSCIGFKLKEVTFFDKKSLMATNRLLGICPLFKNDATGETLEAFWLYYPELRSFLREQKIAKKPTPYIESLDDLFYFKYFTHSFTAYMADNEFKETKSFLYDVEALELEHDFWLYFFGKL